MFELTLFVPTGGAGSVLLLEHVKSIGGLDDLNPSVSLTEQKYKQATRSYAGLPEKTTLDLTVVFSMNLNYDNENYIYTTLRRWTNKIWDPLTGASGMKRDYVGSGIIVQYNRDGSIYRKIVLQDTFPTGQLQVGGDLAYDNYEAAEATIQLRSDCWDEQLIGL
jgi:hypothetical protein